jgi:rhomboid protease GluP
MVPARIDWRAGWATDAILLILLAVFLVESARPGGSQSVFVLWTMGAITPTTLSQGHVWRLVASIFLHIGITHLIGNAIAIFWLGRMAERLYGPLRYVGIFLLSGLGGALLTALLGTAAITAGASEAIWGIMGALLVGSWQHRGADAAIDTREVRQSIVGVIILNAFISLTPGVSLTSHAGGCLVGATLGAIIPFAGTAGGKGRALGAAVGIGALVSAGALLLSGLA